MNNFKFSNFVKAEFFDKFGVKYAEEYVPNGVTTVGLNHILGSTFHAETQKTTWYVGLIDNAGTPTLAAADTMASHTWTECTAYAGDRKEWTEGAAAAGVMTNAVTVDFAINDTKTLYGVFINTDATGTAGILWATAAFAATQAVNNGDTVKITYTITAS